MRHLLRTFWHSLAANNGCRVLKRAIDGVPAPKFGQVVGSRRVAKAATCDRKGNSVCTHFAVTGGSKQTCWEHLAVLRRSKIHDGAGGCVGGEEFFSARRIDCVCAACGEVVAKGVVGRRRRVGGPQRLYVMVGRIVSKGGCYAWFWVRLACRSLLCTRAPRKFTKLTQTGSVAGIDMYVTRVNSDLSVDCRNPSFYVQLCIWQSKCVMHPL